MITSQLAILGGEPAIPEGPPRWPPEMEEVRSALLAAYASGDWGRYHGPACERLRERLSGMHANSEVLLCASGTVTVERAHRGLQIGPGDEVLLAGYDFPGNFRAIEAVGARPVLIDLAADSFSLDPAQFAAAASPAVKGLIVSHLHGALAPMPALCEIAGTYGWKIVEDACQTPGALIAGRPAGTWGDCGVLSFGGSKLLTAGRGGAVLARRAEVVQRIRIHSERGNAAMPLSELQAAVLLPQLDRLPAWNMQRGEAVRRLRKTLSASPHWKLPRNGSPADATAWYKLPIAYRPKSGGPHRAAVLAALGAEGIDIGPGFHGFWKRPERVCRHAGPLPRSEAASEELMLLHHPLLLAEDEMLQRAADAFAKVATWIGE